MAGAPDAGRRDLDQHLVHLQQHGHAPAARRSGTSPAAPCRARRRSSAPCRAASTPACEHLLLVVVAEAACGNCSSTALEHRLHQRRGCRSGRRRCGGAACRASSSRGPACVSTISAVRSSWREALEPAPERRYRDRSSAAPAGRARNATASTMPVSLRSSSIWRASVARLSSRSVRGLVISASDSRMTGPCRSPADRACQQRFSSQSGTLSSAISSSIDLARPDDVPRVAVDQHLGHQRARIVGRGHHRAVGAGGHHREQVAFLDAVHRAVLGEVVAGLADRADDVGGDPRGRLEWTTGWMSWCAS